MSRGEPLANPVVLENLVKLENVLGELAAKRNLDFKLKISSIIPVEAINRGLDAVFHKTKYSQLYYSLYSVDSSFRKRWLPNAAHVEVVMEQIRELQDIDPCFIVVLHWALIHGENDKEQDIDNVGEVIKYYGIKARFNLVRYNPYSEAQGKESTEVVLHERLSQLSSYMRVDGSKMIPKVGFDVHASCGMFVPGLT
jgi:adenine C2-methylase RlmN of 23S rRNA A2503 and tRNA A37